MYANYHSLKTAIEKDIYSQQSVLSKFPDQIARSIVQACAKHLSQFTSSQLPLTFNIKSERSLNDLSINSTSSTNRDSIHHHHSHYQSFHSQHGQHYNQHHNHHHSNHHNDIYSSIIVLETAEQVNWVLEVIVNLTLF